MSIEALARPDIVAMRPYSSARKEAPGEGVLLNANEAPRSLLGEAGWEGRLNRYPEPQPERLVTALANLYGVPEEFVLVTRGGPVPSRMNVNYTVISDHTLGSGNEGAVRVNSDSEAPW